jgi:hypothetical protein
MQQLAEKEEMFNRRAGVETEYEQLKQITQQWQAEAEKYKEWAQQWQSYQLAQLPDAGTSATYQQLLHQQRDLEQQLQYGWKAFESQSLTLANAVRECEEKERKVEELEKRVASLERDGPVSRDIQVGVGRLDVRSRTLGFRRWGMAIGNRREGSTKH